MPRPFYVISHRVNDLESISRAVKLGANAIECDIRYDDGEGFFVSHNWPDFDPVDIIEYLQTAADLAQANDKVALLIFDCKTSVAERPSLALPLLELIRDNLTNHVPISILISTASYENRAFLGAMAGELRAHEAVAIDEHDDPTQVATYLRERGIDRQAYGNGTFVAGVERDVPSSILQAISMKALERGPRFVYVWTLNRKDSIRNYLRMGVDGVFVNDGGLFGNGIAKLLDVLHESEFQPKLNLAPQVHDPFSPASKASYVLTVETGGRRHSGTDANLRFRLVGQQGTLSTRINAKPPGLFETGDRNKVTLIGDEIGNLETLTVWRDTAGNAPGWWLRAITVESTRLRQSHRFNFNIWVPRRGATRWVGQAAYSFSVKTTDRRWAGTDATVTFLVRGTQAWFRHEVDGSGSRFERDRLNTFKVEGPDVGELQTLTVSHDGSGDASDWHLDWVRIRGPRETRRFDFNTWIKSRPVTRS